MMVDQESFTAGVTHETDNRHSESLDSGFWQCGGATETALLRYRGGLQGLSPDMCLVRIRCDLVNYGMVDDAAALQEVTVDVDRELATWLDNLGALYRSC